MEQPLKSEIPPERILKRPGAAPAAMPSNASPRAAVTYPKTPVELLSLADAMVKGSPRPWSVVIGRMPIQRIDILDATGQLVCHFHPVEPKAEVTANWLENASLIVASINSFAR